MELVSILGTVSGNKTFAVESAFGLVKGLIVTLQTYRGYFSTFSDVLGLLLVFLAIF